MSRPTRWPSGAWPGPEADDPAPKLDGDKQADRHLTCIFQATVKNPKGILKGYSKTQFESGDVVINILGFLDDNCDDSTEQYISAKSCDTGRVMSWSYLSNNLDQVWLIEPNKELHFTVPGLNPPLCHTNTSSVLSAMMSCSALESNLDESSWACSKDDSDSLEALWGSRVTGVVREEEEE